MTAMRTITIQELEFEAPSAKFVEGHVCNVAEARQLSQAYVEALRNGFAARLRSKLAKKAEGLPEGTEVSFDEAEVDALRAEFAEYWSDYEFSERSGPRQSTDPVTREAVRIAKERLRAAIAKKGIDIKTISDDKFEEMVTALSNKADIRAEAERRVNAVKEISLDALDELAEG